MNPRSDAASCADARGSETLHSVEDNFTSVTESVVAEPATGLGAVWAVLSAITLFLSLVASLATLRTEALTSLRQSFGRQQG